MDDFTTKFQACAEHLLAELAPHGSKPIPFLMMAWDDATGTLHRVSNMQHDEAMRMAADSLNTVPTELGETIGGKFKPTLN